MLNLARGANTLWRRGLFVSMLIFDDDLPPSANESLLGAVTLFAPDVSLFAVNRHIAASSPS